MTRIRLAVALLTIALLVTGCGSQGSTPAQSSPPSPATGAAAPGKAAKPLDLNVESLGGQQRTVSALRDGKPALLEFWGST